MAGRRRTRRGRSEGSNETPPRGTNTLKSAVRALHILDAVEQSVPGRRLAELSAELGLDKATTLRTLETLVAERVLVKDTDAGLYSANPTSWTYLLQFLSPAFSLISSVQGVLDDLAETTAATSLLVLPRLGGRKAAAPMYSLPRTGMFYDPARAPQTAPLHTAAAGKCLLASLSKN